MALPDIKIRNAKAKEKPYKLADGGGLFLYITPTGSKLWRLKYRYTGKERVYSIGAYPLVGAAEARTVRDSIKKMLASDIDPIQHRRLTKHQKAEASENTFEAVARRWLPIKKVEASHQARSLRRLELHAFPRIGYRPIGEIKTIEVANCLEEIAGEGINETANRIKQLIQQVFRYAVRRGIIEHNPAGDLRGIIGHKPVESRACIPPAELPPLLRAIDTYKGNPLTIAAIKLLALTFVRTGELIAARWDEIDWARSEWHIPAERMKMRNAHVVPLAKQSIAILEGLKPLTGRQEKIFHSPANISGHISNNAVLSALKRMGYNGRMTGHGFRALASTILNEQHQYHPDVIERQLAHADRNEVRAVYNRADYLLERIKMMQDWADYLDERLKAKDTVIRADFKKTRSS